MRSPPPSFEETITLVLAVIFCSVTAILRVFGDPTAMIACLLTGVIALVFSGLLVWHGPSVAYRIIGITVIGGTIALLWIPLKIAAQFG